MKKDYVTQINLVRKIAWSYAKSTGIDFDDLFQEAMIVYWESLHRYNPKRGKPSTYIWVTVHSTLKNYVKREQKHNAPLVALDVLETETYTPTQLFELMSPAACDVANIVFRAPNKFIEATIDGTTAAEERIVRTMLRQGYSYRKIISGLYDLKTALAR